jgi:ABC-2 type transport system permease protein
MRKIFSTRYGWLFLLLLLVVINYAASLIYARIDLTSEKRFTLSKGTREILKNLDDELEIDIFLKGEFPAKFRKLTNSVTEFIRLLKESNSAKIHYRFISPEEEIPGRQGMKYSDSLAVLNALPINLKAQVKTGESSSFAYPFALLKYKGRQELVTLFTVPAVPVPGESPEKVINESEALLEYRFVKSLDAMLDPRKPMVGYLVGNGEPLIGKRVVDSTLVFADPRTADLEQTLRRDYNVFTLNLSKQPFIPDTFKVLVMVKPSIQFTDDELIKIDQFIMRGGNLLCFIDNLIAEQDSLSIKPETIAYDRNLNLTEMFFRYGARINTDLIMDLQSDFMPFAIGGSAEKPQFEFLHWNYYPLFDANRNHPVTKNIGLVAGRFVNSVDTVAAPGIKKTMLLFTSANSRTISTPALISTNENRNTPEDAKFKRNAIPAAVLLEGRFTSVFRNRATQAQIDSLTAMRIPFLQQAAGEGKIVIVADGDMVLNDVSPKDGPLPMGMNFFTAGSNYEYSFANRDFLLNCLEYLVNKPGIMETRNKEIVLRLLDSRKVKEQKTKWQLINIALPIFLIIVFGSLYQQLRKRKYAS